MKEETIRVLVVEPEKAPYEKEIENTLEAMQKEVGGYIQVIYPFDDAVGLVCNEEGKLGGFEANRALLYSDTYPDWKERGYKPNELYDIIYGPFFVVSVDDPDDDGNFCSLTDEQVERYKERFADRESWIVVDDDAAGRKYFRLV